MAKIIAFSGKAGSGKDTAAGLLMADMPEIVHLSFAAPLKELATKYFPYCDVVKKDPISRATLQGLGTLMREEVDPDYWINRLLYSIQPEGIYVITDLRYMNEYKELSLLRPQHEVDFIRLEGRRYEQSPEIMSHPSETELDSVRFTDVYNNTGTIEDLHRYLRERFNGLYTRKTSK